ncbi:MAG: hypothetical protein ACREK8_05095 [Gemmatimonadales bacterium]
MDLDDIKAQLDRIFAAGQRTSTRDEAAGLRAALVEFKVAMGQLREGLSRSERELELARREANDYGRRGEQAVAINDQETAHIASTYTAKARERIDLLERKVIVLRDELAIAQREYDATMQRFQAAARGVPPAGSASSESLSGADQPGGIDSALLDQRAKEAAVEAQLAHLKKKLGDTR